MITKEKFCGAIKCLQRLTKAENDLYDASNGCISLYEFGPYSDLINMYIELLEDLLELSPEEKEASDISYFIYDLNCGEDWEPYTITDEYGNDIDVSTAEKLYDFLVS